MLLPLEPPVNPSRANTRRRLIDLRESPWRGSCHLSAGLPVRLSRWSCSLQQLCACVCVCACVALLITHAHATSFQSLTRAATSTCYISTDRQLPQPGGEFIPGFAFTRESFANSIEWNERLIGAREAGNINSLQSNPVQMDSYVRGG